MDGPRYRYFVCTASSVPSNRSTSDYSICYWYILQKAKKWGGRRVRTLLSDSLPHPRLLLGTVSDGRVQRTAAEHRFTLRLTANFTRPHAEAGQGRGGESEGERETPYSAKSQGLCVP